MPATTCYRILRHRDSRDSWYEVESMTADGGRSWIATVDTAADARDLVRRLEAADNRPPVVDQAARDAATAAELAAARASADYLQGERRAISRAGGPAAWHSYRVARFAAPLCDGLRLEAARRLRAARAAYLAADEAADLAAKNIYPLAQ